jgi:hypothetical protein
VSAEFVGGFDALAGDAWDDPALAQPGAQGRDVVGLVGVELGRLSGAGVLGGSGSPGAR